MMSLKKSRRDGASSCSMTPSECSGSDSDYESDHGEDRFDHSGNLMNIRWIGPGRTIPILTFDTEGFFAENPTLRNCGAQNNLACKVSGDSQILRDVFVAHGFREVGMMHRRYNLAWTGRHTKPSFVKKMAYCHTINHFPRTEELTRKDKLYKNIIKMQQTKGKEHFDFVPLSFKMPSQYRSLYSHYKKEKGLYIVKPVSLSRGRGVFVIDNPKKINSVHIEGPGETHCENRYKNIVSKYIPNPLVINGYKCDLRIYVTVTSFDPVVIYMYNEGLTRFATVKYDLSSNCLNERCMHLTNYSINMDSVKYIKNIDSTVENEGSKWSLGALLRYFKSQGKDTAAIMHHIEDVVIKTILSVEWKVGAACKQYINHRHNCFELFGFDILLDDNYKPWLIEVNLSPSLCCDTPLDLKVKSNMLCDLLNLVGIRCYDPHMQNLSIQERKNVLTMLRNRLKNSYGHYYYRICRDACQRAWGMRHSRKRLKAMLDLEKNWSENSLSETKKTKVMSLLATLTRAEVEIIQQVREEDSRRHGWVRIFPTSDSWDTYHTFMDFPTTNNLILHQRLYPERHKVMTAGRSPLAGMVTPSPSVNELFFQVTGQRKDTNERISKAYIEKLQRMREYETPLSILPPPNFRQKQAPHDCHTANGLGSVLSVPVERTFILLLLFLSRLFFSKSAQELEYISSSWIHVNTETKADTSPQINKNPSWNEGVLISSYDEELIPDRSWEHSNELMDDKERLFPPAYNSEMSAGEPQLLVDQFTVASDKSHDIVGLLSKGHSLTHMQAREAFTAYLWKIQKMLLLKIGGSRSQENADTPAGLMDLVTTFLKQSVQYLIIPICLDLPEEYKSLKDRVQFLAEGLAKFIKLYTEETNALKAAGDQISVDKSRAMSKNSLLLDDHTFEQYIHKANIKELEMLLILYSRHHDPVATFLGKLSPVIQQTDLR